MKKNKILLIILTILVMAVIIITCVLAYKISTENYVAKPLFTLETYPRVDASLATQPLTDAYIKAFVGDDVDIDSIEYTNTHPAYIKLINGETDLIVVTEPSEEELELAKKAGVELVVTPVVKEGFVFYVNGNNPVDSLTLEQVQKIYTGEITNWKAVGGNDEEIRAFQRPANSGSQTGMLSLVMNGLDLMAPPKEDLVETMEAIINLVSDYDNGKNSIGYSYYYYATTMYSTIDENVANGIKLLKINGVAPNDETIQNGEYPLQTAYYIVTRKDDENNQPVQTLKKAMLSAKGQNVAKEAGYVKFYK